MHLSEGNALFQVTSNIEPSVQKIVTWAETLLIGSQGKGNGSKYLRAQQGHCQLLGDCISESL